MRAPSLSFCLITLSLVSPIAIAEAKDAVKKAPQNEWQVYSAVDLFAFSEAVSITEFIDDFDDNLVSGETAFSQNSFELGTKWRSFRFAYVDRYDYITKFSKDTAFVYHADKNNIELATDRAFDLFLSVERVHARGFKAGYTYQFNDELSFDVAGTYYFDISELQSGKVRGNGSLDPLNDDVLSEARTLAPHRYSSWKVVSFEAWPNIVVKSDFAREAVFEPNPNGYRRQLAELDYIIDYNKSRSVNRVARVDLTLKSQVPVTRASFVQ